ncbi:MAG: tRNA isopentenyl-2-thiomethyl-A-37 hydroxylase MiaE, partial [Bacteroidota bacterium]
MKRNLDISVASSQEWIDAVMNDFDSFLQDHADCERKASATAMSLVAKYPDRVEIIPPLIDTAVEELEH